MMTSKKLYDYREVISATYYDVIDMMGEDGLDAKLTAYDLLAVMAAPCTRLDYNNTEAHKRTLLMKAVHSFMLNNKRITSLTHQGLVKELNHSFLPSLTAERLTELLTSFKMVMGFDEDGYAVFDPRIYAVYKGNLDRGMVTRIQYASFSGQGDGKRLPDTEIVKTYHLHPENGVSTLDLGITSEDWVDILRGASPKALQLIGAFVQLEGKGATNTEIEELFGINRDSINGVVAGLGNRAMRIMGIEVLYENDTTHVCWIFPFNNGRNESGRGYVWELRPEVAEAYRKLTES